MFKNLLLCFLYLNSFVSFSQEIVSATPVTLKKNHTVFQTVNNNKKEVTLFINEKEKIKAIQLNEKMQIIDSISTESLNPKTHANMIGYNTNNDNTRLFWSSNNYENIFTQLYDFKSRKVETQSYSLDIKDEIVLQKFSQNDNFYILTIIKKTNTFNLHIFDSEGKYQLKSIDLSQFDFYTNTYLPPSTVKYTKTNLFGIIKENLLPFEAPNTIQNITPENPTSITEGAKKRKCYLNGKQLTITFDNNNSNTQVIIIDLEHFTASVKIIKKHATKEADFFTSSGSFYFDNKLYQIKSSSTEFYFTIKDLDDNLIKEYAADADNPISFKNTTISQEKGGHSGSIRTLEKTSQFIRKVNDLHPGLSCYLIGQNTLITLGGISEAQQTTGQIALQQFGLVGALTSMAIYGVYNPTMQSFNSYANRKVVKIDGVFDKNGNHIEGDLQPLAFDKIRTFFDDKKDFSSPTLFKMDNFYYLGYYENKSKEYVFRKFTD